MRAVTTRIGCAGLLFAGLSVQAMAAQLWEIAPGSCPNNPDRSVVACLLVDAAPELVYPGRQFEFELLLPAADGTPSPVAARQLPGSSNAHVWQGRLDGDDFSNVTFSVYRDAFAGVITTSQGSFYYRLRRANPGLTVIERLDSRLLVDQGPEVTIRGTCPPPYAGPGKQFDCGQPADRVIDILVVYSREAHGWAGGRDAIRAWIAAAEERANQSFRQSGIGVRINVIYSTLVKYRESGVTDKDLWNLVKQQEGLHKVHRLRDRLDADVVVLIVAGQENGPAGHACTLQESYLENPAFADYGFAVVRVSQLNDTFIHELGHLMGAEHQDIHRKAAKPYGHGYYMNVTTSCGPPWKTIMARSECSNCAPILYWSNPRQERCVGEQIGKPLADNALTLIETACTVSRWQVP